MEGSFVSIQQRLKGKGGPGLRMRRIGILASGESAASLPALHSAKLAGKAQEKK